MTTQRSAWIAARARNAARRGGWIAVIGSMAVVGTMLVLVVLPNEADRGVRRQIAGLANAPDTVPLVANVALIRAGLADTTPLVPDSVLQQRTSQMVSDTDTVASAIAPAPRGTPPVVDSLAVDLRDRILRARLSPLPDSYKALAASPLLTGSARVAPLLDSLERLAQERDAHAALGGPGARYAALTAQMTAIGQRLIGVAEGQLVLQLRANALESAAGRSEAVRADSAVADSVARATRDRQLGEFAHADSVLNAARALHRVRDSTERALQQRINTVLPPFAMLIAALVVGVAIGYATVLGRELRTPTVSDAMEAERFTASPVFVHAVTRPGTILRRATRRSNSEPPPLIDQHSEVFALLHLALSGVGDVVSDVEIRAAEPVVSAAVAIGIAAVAARESHTALLVESTRKQSMLSHYLGFKPSHDPHAVTLGRDAHFDVWHGSTAADAYGPLARRYDLRLHLVDRGTVDSPSVARDVIICVHQGHTTLAWLARAMQHAKQRDQRVRAVLLWHRALPAA